MTTFKNTLKNKIDFVAFVGVYGANPNGDPLDDGRPRTNSRHEGLITPEAIKHKIRNRMLDKGYPVLYKANERVDDGIFSVQGRIEAVAGKPGSVPEDEYKKKICEVFIDVRAFGATLAYGKKDDESAGGVSIPIKGPTTFHVAKSLSPIEIENIQITKCTTGAKKDEGKKGSDTMGIRKQVDFGVYRIQGSINTQFASQCGFTDADAEVLKDCLRTLFVNDASSARPDGSMEVLKLYWFEHNCPVGQYSAAAVFRSVKSGLKDPDKWPESVDDYDIHVDELPGLKYEEIQGI